MGLNLLRTRCVLLAVAVAAGSSGCGASSTRIGPGRYAIECRRDQTNCYLEAERVCRGSYNVLDSAGQQGAIVVANTNGNTTTAQATPTYRGQMLIECRGFRKGHSSLRAGGPDSRGAAKVVTGPPAEEKQEKEEEEEEEQKDDLAPPPPGAAGFLFGSSPADFVKACEAGGHEVVELKQSLSCSGTAAPLDVPAVASARFCANDGLCLLDIGVLVPDPVAALEMVGTLRDHLSARYGHSTPKHIIPGGCEEDLASCLSNKSASVSYSWTWKTGSVITLVVLPGADGALTVSIRYATPEGQRQVEAQGL